MGREALTVVQRYFPKVERVVDAKRGVGIEVLKEDCRGARKKSLDQCALARACMRAEDLDGALVSASRT